MKNAFLPFEMKKNACQVHDRGSTLLQSYCSNGDHLFIIGRRFVKVMDKPVEVVWPKCVLFDICITGKQLGSAFIGHCRLKCHNGEKETFLLKRVLSHYKVFVLFTSGKKLFMVLVPDHSHGSHSCSIPALWPVYLDISKDIKDHSDTILFQS